MLRAGNFILLLLAAALLAGCEGAHVASPPVKHIGDKVTDEDLQAFLRVVDALPDKKLTGWPEIFVAPPEWSESRTLPVAELVLEEQSKLDEHWSVAWVMGHLPEDVMRRRALRRERLSEERFVGIALAVGAAMSRSVVHPRTDLETVALEGMQRITPLRRDGRAFATLGPEERHHVLMLAASLTRADRARRLHEVPPENVALVRANWDQLAAIFPAEFTKDPVATISDRLAEEGIPFEELPEGGNDSTITVEAETMIIGTDPPDPELAPRTSERAAKTPSLLPL